MKILVLNGPNLNLLGRREPGVYGSVSFDDYLPQLRKAFPGVEIDYFQSNVEGVMIDKMQEVGSNVHTREDFRHKSMLSAACLGVICGFGLDSYRLAVNALLGPATTPSRREGL